MAQEKKKIQLKILKINKSIYDGTVDSLTVPSINGQMTILPEHEPLISILKEGTITIRSGEEKNEIKIEKGYLETTPERTSILL